MCRFQETLLVVAVAPLLSNAQLPAGTAARDQLTADLVAIMETSRPSAQLKYRLADSILALAEKPHAPSKTLVQEFANDLAGGLAGRRQATLKLTPDIEKTLLIHELTVDIEKVLHSAGTSTVDLRRTVSDAQRVLTALGLTASQTQTVAKSLRAIGENVRGPEDLGVKQFLPRPRN